MAGDCSISWKPGGQATKANQELIDGLNSQLRREVTTFLEYILQAAPIRGAQHKRVRKIYLEEVADEVRHTQYLASQISLLGSTPKLHPDLTPPPTGVRQMLENDNKEARTDVKNYNRLAELAEKEANYALKTRMEERAADEDSPCQEMCRLLPQCFGVKCPTPLPSPGLKWRPGRENALGRKFFWGRA